MGMQYASSEDKRQTNHDSGLRAVFFGIFLMIVFGSVPAFCADVNVLIVGTSRDATQYSSSYGSSKAYDITKVRAELEKILVGAGMGTVEVSLHDFGANYSNGTGNQLISEFYNVDTSFPPVASDFWQNLRGESGTHWDYVILMDEPYTIEYFPGFYTLGVSEIAKEVAKGGAETVLLMTWPGNGSASSVNHYKEVVYRTGRSLGCKVVPAGLAWQSLGGTHGATHPTADGAYLAAASIYSRVWGVEGGQDNSASTSTYAYNDTLADAVHQVVKDNKGKVQYSGAFVQPSNIFAKIGDDRREWRTAGSNSSTENTLRSFLMLSGRNSGMDIGDLNVITAPKGAFITRQDAQLDNGASINATFYYIGSPVGYTKDQIVNQVNVDTTTSARYFTNKLLTCPTSRLLPNCTLFAQVNKELPDAPINEYQHAGRTYFCPVAAYLHCLNSGRCVMIPESAENMIEYVSYKAGYETAWKLSKLQGRAPGFQVKPSDWKRHEVDPETSETMTVRFMLPPKQNVIVNVSTNFPWATVTPQTLTFTPENYATPQNVTVSVTAAAASLRGSLFKVNYSTTSSDEVYHNLSDSWEYGVNTLPSAIAQNLSVLANQSKPIILTATDPDLVSRITYSNGRDIPKQNITYAIVDNPQNGNAVVNGNTATYTPNTDFVGTDSFTYRVFDGLAYGAPNTLSINVLAEGQYQLNLLVNPGAEFGMLGWTGNFSSYLNTVGNIAVAKANSGSYSFRAVRGAGKTVELYQDVDLSDYSAHINAGLQSFKLAGWGNDLNRDDARLALEFRDAGGQVLDTPYQSPRIASSTWKLVEQISLAPPNAVTARVILMGTWLVDDRNYCHFDDLSIMAIRPANMAPVAVEPPQISIAKNVPTVIPIAATDADRFPSNNLTFEIVGNPTNGDITGWQNGMPVYTPDQNFLGTDSFTFRVYDGNDYSVNVATANILVRENQAPSIAVRTPVMPASNTIYMCAINGLIFETSITDDGGPYPGNLAISWEQVSGPHPAVFGSPNAEVTTCNWGDFKPGTYVFRVRASDGQYETIRNFTVVALNGGYNISENVAPQVEVGGPYGPIPVGASIALQGVNLFDDGKPLDPGATTLEWQKVSGPGVAIFSDPSKYQTNVVFDTPGTYVVRLTANDGQIKAYNDVETITVRGIPPAEYTNWTGGIFANPFTDTAMESNPDNDGRNNMLEFAFGTDPTRIDTGTLAVDGTRHGDPLVKLEIGGRVEFFMLRRKDNSLIYTACFSSDLITFYDNDNTTNPVVVYGPSSVDSGYEVVKVPFPTSLPNGQAARFVRVRVSSSP